jgi:aminobenzoyl-glutamate utilization protein B
MRVRNLCGGRAPIVALAIVAACVLLCGAAIASAANLGGAKRAAADKVTALAPEVTRLGAQIWSYAEVGMRETRSSALLEDTLEHAGFRVQRGVADLPTAFVASHGSGEPVIGILAEYDALPGVGNVAAAERRARPDGVQAGHGCGHNLLGTASITAAVALSQVMAERHIKGTLKVFGTPDEEEDIGKLYMAKAHVFDGIDAAIEWHPEVFTGTANETALALNNFQIEFFGRAAHASEEPEKGRSALHALELASVGINLFREQMVPTARVHYYVANGGVAPNIIPEYTRLWLNVRDVSRAGVESLYSRVLLIAQGASVAMGVEYRVTLFSALHPLLLNRPLQEAMQRNLEALGPVPFRADDQNFARALQHVAGIPTTGYDARVQPLAPEPAYDGGSTDVAEVSWIAPTVGLKVTTAPAGIPWHSWVATAAHGAPSASTGTLYAAKAIAFMGLDLFEDSGLRARAKRAFLASTGGRPYVPGIPLEQRPPLERAAGAASLGASGNGYSQ